MSDKDATLGQQVDLVACVTAPMSRSSSGSQSVVEALSDSAVVIHAPGQSSEEFPTSRAYGKGFSVHDIFDKSIDPLISSTISHGMSACVLAIGSATSERTSTLQRLMPQILRSVQQKLEERKSAAGSGNNRLRQRRNRSGAAKFSIRFSAVEIKDEVIQDLLSPANRELITVLDGTFGRIVRNVTFQGPTADIDDLMEAANESFKASSPGATAIFRIDTLLELGDANRPDGEGSLRSSLFIVDVAGSEKLAQDPSTVRLKEGVRQSKSLFALSNIADVLAEGENDGELSLFKESKLTQVIEEALGGNCALMCIAFLDSSQHEESIATMHLGATLARCVTYPIKTSGRAQGLLRRLRGMINLRGGDRDIDGNYDESEFNLKLSELEGKAVRDKLEILKLREDKTRVVEKLKEMQEKYKVLNDDKRSVQRKLIESEEEGLKTANALLDMQVENNQLVERSEAEKYELLSKIMNAENEIPRAREQGAKERRGRRKAQDSVREARAAKAGPPARLFGASGKL